MKPYSVAMHSEMLTINLQGAQEGEVTQVQACRGGLRMDWLQIHTT